MNVTSAETLFRSLPTTLISPNSVDQGSTQIVIGQGIPVDATVLQTPGERAPIALTSEFSTIGIRHERRGLGERVRAVVEAIHRERPS
ncbi:MAG: hypothetical protein RIS70_4056 [Planctomycetota bacterium]|jgi:hypothetical protein